ncbi:MAG: hypothetical protein ACK559_08645 [bacterium]
MADETRDGAVELHEHRLADGAVGVERLLMAAGRVEPHEARRQVHEGDAVLADHLQGGRRPEADGLRPRRPEADARPPGGDLRRRSRCHEAAAGGGRKPA